MSLKIGLTPPLVDHMMKTSYCDIIVREKPFKEVSEFLSALSRDNKRWEGFYISELKRRHAGWIFCGHSNSHWKLIPLVFREETILEYKPNAVYAPHSKNGKQINAEYYLIEEFRRILDAQGLPVPEDSQEFRADWLYQCCNTFRWV